MIELARFNHPRLAFALNDYLVSQGIHAQIKPYNELDVSIWVAEVDLQRARTIYKEFSANPNDEKYLAASWQVEHASGELSYGAAPLNLGKRFWRLPLLVKAVFVLSLLVFIALMSGEANTVFQYLKFNVKNPITWLTPSILHFSAVHIVFNLMWWLYLAPKVSKTCSTTWLVSLFVFSSLVSSWLQYLLVGPDFGGLSGVVYGLFGFCWLYGLRVPTSQLKLNNGIIGFVLVWMVLGFMDVLFVSMANWAHLGGLVSGMALGALAAQTNVKKEL